MQMVIDIDDRIANQIKNHIACTNPLQEIEVIGTLILAIQNGVILPEQHGRLIDADALECDSFNRSFDDYAFSIIDNAPTVLEGSDNE